MNVERTDVVNVKVKALKDFWQMCCLCMDVEVKRETRKSSARRMLKRDAKIERNKQENKMKKMKNKQINQQKLWLCLHLYCLSYGILCNMRENFFLVFHVAHLEHANLD